MKADMLGVPTVASRCPEPTSLGAAILAEASLSGCDIQQLARQWVDLQSPHLPAPQPDPKHGNAGFPFGGIIASSRPRYYPLPSCWMSDQVGGG